MTNIILKDISGAVVWQTVVPDNCEHLAGSVSSLLQTSVYEPSYFHLSSQGILTNVASGLYALLTERKYFEKLYVDEYEDFVDWLFEYAKVLSGNLDCVVIVEDNV